jgi:hypothetical protein
MNLKKIRNILFLALFIIIFKNTTVFADQQYNYMYGYDWWLGNSNLYYPAYDGGPHYWIRTPTVDSSFPESFAESLQSGNKISNTVGQWITAPKGFYIAEKGWTKDLGTSRYNSMFSGNGIPYSNVTSYSHPKYSAHGTSYDVKWDAHYRGGNDSGPWRDTELNTYKGYYYHVYRQPKPHKGYAKPINAKYVDGNNNWYKKGESIGIETSYHDYEAFPESSLSRRRWARLYNSSGTRVASLGVDNNSSSFKDQLDSNLFSSYSMSTTSYDYKNNIIDRWFITTNAEGTYKIGSLAWNGLSFSVSDTESDRESYVIKVDGTAPTINGTTTYEWTKDNVTVKLRASDNSGGSGMDRIELYNSSGVKVASATGTNELSYLVTQSGKMIYEAKAYDKVGNETKKTINVNIDKIAPLGDFTVENITTTGFDVVVKNISDAHSGVSKIKLKSWTDEYYSEITQEKSISQGQNSITFRVNAKDYDNKCGTYYYEVVIEDKVGNEKKVSSFVDVPYPKPIVSQIEISNYEYEDVDKNIYWVKTNDNYTVKVYGKTNPDNVRYKIDSLHALVRNLGAIDFSEMRAFDAYIPNYEPIDSKYYDFSVGTNTLNTSTDLEYESYSVRKEDGYTYSYFDLNMSDEEEITINPMVRILEAKLDSDWNAYSVIVKSDGTAPTGKVVYDYNENTFELDITVSNIIEKGSGVNKIWVEFYPEYEEERKITQDLINTNSVYKGKRNLFELFPDSIEPIEVVVKAIDKVGNEGELFRKVFDPFKIEATITRDWEPYQSIFQEGELGVARVKLFGGIDLVEIEFPEELNKLAEESDEYSRLDTYKYLIPQKKDSFDYKFYVPIGAEHKIYTVKVTGYKNDKKKIVYPNMEVRGNILNEVRTRIR